MVRAIDPDGLRNTGDRLQDVSDRFLTELRTFLADLAAFGAPWGDDDIGSLIGAACEEVTAYAAECFESAIEELGVVGVDLNGMAHRGEETERLISEHFTGFSRELG
ncbi:hypothetical protein DLE60_01830 [Micromonospora globispora]|uniref:PE domain-containing protein n=1 Tax=Micromonospora globispora TaxID=1450148 RepID=A0A317KFX7_9ACTN|nr:hypothetical protein [Micromonospora globispora]PWU51963.1 hypothetical protein DLJ46_03920 [Micromonospora globispora]PWU62154.1 hypothetical protein DLE60_01830 [Micromonospora globispora]RQW99762.1 hypothetical protein DKL51_07885 [Micromonospora globispora]